MPLIVPILRAAFLFLNIFDTYKTLKLPPPSARNGGKPSVRAMSHRKRSMKGCMTVWLIWCCFAIYERTVDSVIGMFIPFYNEIKSLVLIFFMLTRSRGAEPVYLHIMRPMIKPYSAPLDSLLDITNTFGDLVVLICAIPYHMVMSIYYRWAPKKPQNTEPKTEEAKIAADEETKARSPSDAGEDEEDAPTVTVHGTVRTRRRPLQDAHERARVTRANSRVRVLGSTTKKATQKPVHEIWYPPPPAYDESPPSEPNEPQQGLPTPPAEDQLPLSHDGSMDEWRRYEPFPSAYPATPMPPRIHLTMSNGRARHPQLEEIPEDQSHYYSYSANESIEMEEQDFHESLLLPREEPRSAGDLSDDEHGAQGMASDDEMDIEEEDDDDDDDFNVTLRTPYAIKRVKNMSNMTSSSMDRDSNISSAGLSTVDNGSPLMRSRTNSGASAALYDSDSSSVAGKKRPLSSTEETGPLRRPLHERTATSQTVRPKTKSIHLEVKAPRMVRTKTTSSSSSAENKDVGADATTAVKLRRVGSKDDSRKEPIVRTTRPAARAGAERGTREAAVRKATTVASVPRGTQARPTITRPVRMMETVKAT